MMETDNWPLPDAIDQFERIMASPLPTIIPFRLLADNYPTKSVIELSNFSS
jgi:hypothetical protein